MKAYDDRFTEALQTELGQRFTVTNAGHDLIIIRHAEGGMMLAHPYGRDKRLPVSMADVRQAIEAGISRARRELPHLTPEARAEARAMLAEV